MNKFALLLISISLIGILAQENTSEKCGEGKDKDVHKCVPFHMCGTEAGSILSETQSGMISLDVRYSTK